jgi:anthranilate/para-aminobenzoate synthase component I
MVVTHSLGRWIDPAVAWHALLADEPLSFWLDCGPDATTGTSYLGAGSHLIDADVLATLSATIPAPSATASASPSFQLGWVGWLGYELRGETMHEPVPPHPLPTAALMWVERAIAFDHATGEVTLLSLTGDDTDWAFDGVPLAPVEPRAATATWRYTDDEYLAMVAACQDAIAAGDAYQLCLTSEVAVDVRPDPFQTYLALRESSPSHHGGLVVTGETALLSATPEQFLTVTPSGRVSSSPIKGTRKRSSDPVEDTALAAELLASDKERAENLMIVDLMRNDIGRVSSVGSVIVSQLLAVESYSHVHQLVSTIEGQLADGLTAVDAVAATFPAGSMTGAPKLSATRILAALEQRPRGIYSGAFGYFSLDGSVDLAMVIRSIVITPDGANIGAGGGITALSVPEEELAEVKLKAAALLRVLGAA